jgi:ribosomal protein L37E
MGAGMSCCGKVVGNVVQIAKGFTALVTGVKYEFTDGRIRVCQACGSATWRVKTLWCSQCGCYVPAAARVKDKKCPLDKWDK